MKIGRMVAGASALTVTGLLALPGVAWAHIASADATCDGLSVSVASYPDGAVTTITIDGETTRFNGDFDWTGAWDSTRDHTWSVIVDDEGTDNDHVFGDTEHACVATTTEPAATTTQPPAVTTTQPPAATTTQPPAVATTQPPTVTTTLTEVTQVLQEATTTTTPAAATTTVAGSSGSGTTGQRGGSLPATGPVTAPLVGVAAVALVAGGALLLVARRRSAD
jgi:LPXTG-motif cell wall-anchored protein